MLLSRCLDVINGSQSLKKVFARGLAFDKTLIYVAGLLLYDGIEHVHSETCPERAEKDREGKLADTGRAYINPDALPATWQ